MMTPEERKKLEAMAKEYRDQAFKNNPNGYSVFPGCNEPDTDFMTGAEAALELRSEREARLVEAVQITLESIDAYDEDLNGYLDGLQELREAFAEYKAARDPVPDQNAAKSNVMKNDSDADYAAKGET